MLFLLNMSGALPPEFPIDQRERLLAEEKQRAKELSDGGKLLAHWKVPLANETVTVWEVEDAAEFHEIIMSLPAVAWSKAKVTVLLKRG